MTLQVELNIDNNLFEPKPESVVTKVQNSGADYMPQKTGKLLRNL